MVPEKNFQNSWKVLTNFKYLLIFRINLRVWFLVILWFWNFLKTFRYILISRTDSTVLSFVILGFWTTMKSKSTGGCKRCTFQIGLIQQKYFPFPITWSWCWQKVFLNEKFCYFRLQELTLALPREVVFDPLKWVSVLRLFEVQTNCRHNFDHLFIYFFYVSLWSS